MGVLNDDLSPMDDGEQSGSSSTPPDYTEKDPFSESGHQTENQKIMPTIKITPPMIMTDSSTNTPTGTPKPKRKNIDSTTPGYIKGLIPMTMAGDNSDDDSDFKDSDAAYDLDKDPLLVDSTEDTETFCVGYIQQTAVKGYRNHKTVLWRVLGGIVLAGYFIYLAFAVAYSPYGAIAPLAFTGAAVLIAFYQLVQKQCGKGIQNGFIMPISDWWDEHWYIIRWFVYPAPLLGFIIYLTVMMTQIRQLQSLSGFVLFFCMVWLTSKHPDKVVWRPVIWGYSLQFLMALLVLQWDKGYAAVEWLSGYVAKIMNFGFHGAAIIYGDPNMMLHVFLMMGLSLLIYIGALLSILYYFGVTQLVASKLAWFLSGIMGTTAIETLAVAANIMLNGMDVMLMLRPYLHKLTMSEFNCFQVGSTSTIAGFMFGVLILYGAPPQHLLTAAVMSAPATIAIAKLHYPETVPEKSITKDLNTVRLSKGTERNMFEAAANGSSIAGHTVLTVVVNYISFMGMLYFMDAILSWLGNRCGYPEISFEWICSYLFFPIALMIGIDVSQCRQIAKVIGLKVFTTEIYSYQVLGRIYDEGLIDDRSKALGTYALCGFSSLSTLAIAVGTWQVVCPQRRPLVTKLMLRVLFQANISCFTTACVAGMFYNDNLAVFDESQGRDPLQKLIVWVLGQGTKLLS